VSVEIDMNFKHLYAIACSTTYWSHAFFFFENKTLTFFPGFDGGIAETTSRNFDDKYLPFIRAKTII
jgi:hypothetical protein